MRHGPATRVALIAGAAVLALLALAGSAYARLNRGRAESLPVFGDAPAFALTDQWDRPVVSTDFGGKVVVANFVYTSCTDVCPLLAVQMRALQERLRQEGLLGGPVQLLSFTVDPVRDTPAVLRAYAERHGADAEAWRFLTGPADTLVPLIVQGFRLGVTALPPAEGAEPYEVIHSTRFVLVDQRGRIRAYYEGRELDIEQVLRDIRGLPR